MKISKDLAPPDPFYAVNESNIRMFDEHAGAVLVEGDLQFFSGVHYYGAIPCDWFTNGFSGHEKKTNRFVFRRND